MGFAKEFKEFAMKGNIVDLAVAVVIGGAFGKIITAFTEAIISPLIALVMGKEEIKAVTIKAGDTVFPIGLFLQSVVDFILVALVLFLMIKALNSMKKQEAAAPPPPAEPSTTDKLLTEIRDALKK